MFLEVHQPIGHRQIVDVEDLAVVLEGGGIFAVRVKHHDVAFGRHFADPVKDQRGRGRFAGAGRPEQRSEEHTSELQSLMRISYAVFCLKKKRLKRTSEKKKLIKPRTEKVKELEI